jgi:D-glycero-beta-D-manno-heptose 1-phosphate adenylyltransferase
MPVVSLSELLKLRADWRERGLRVVLTNGVFDIVHAGHVAYLGAARELGDLLVVALNSDRSTQTLKGPLRPIVPEADRAALLAALRAVDYVTIFDEPTAEAVAAALRPDVYVKGGDYASGPDGAPDLGRLPEGRVVAAYGGRVALLPFAEGRSTSAIITRIAERYGGEG